MMFVYKFSKKKGERHNCHYHSSDKNNNTNIERESFPYFPMSAIKAHIIKHQPL